MIKIVRLDVTGDQVTKLVGPEINCAHGSGTKARDHCAYCR